MVPLTTPYEKEFNPELLGGAKGYSVALRRGFLITISTFPLFAMPHSFGGQLKIGLNDAGKLKACGCIYHYTPSKPRSRPSLCWMEDASALINELKNELYFVQNETRVKAILIV